MPTITVISSPTRKTYWWAEIQKLSRPPASDHYRVLVTRDGQRLMVVMPHPDDECFGCASTIARYGAEGATVSLVTMTRGGAGLWNGRAAGDLRQLTDVRELELRDAAAKLRAFAHHQTQTQEWEPLRKFVEAQGDVEVFSLVGGPHDLSEDDLFAGVEAAS